MNLSEWKEKRSGPWKEAAVCFLRKGDQVLLAMKKRGFGAGKYNGSGGKVQSGESVEEAAVREVKEEIGVEIRKMEKVARIDFYFDEKPEIGQQVSVFICHDFEGEPTESEEMKPEWFEIGAIPYEKMWSSDRYWLPPVLEGKKILAEFLFAGEGEVAEYRIWKVKEQQVLK